MKKLLFLALTIMAMAATAQTKPDPTGQSRYFLIGRDTSLSVFNARAYDYTNNFFDGYASKTIAELGLSGWLAWNEFGDHAELVAMEPTATVYFKNGGQWVECYLFGCTKGGKPYFNRLNFIDKTITVNRPKDQSEPDKVIKTDGATTINIYNQGGAGGAGGNATVNPSTTTPTVTPFGPPAMPGQGFISIPNWQQQGIFMPQQGFIPQQQQMVWCNQQNNGFYWLEGARLVLGTAVQFAEIFANRSPKVIQVNNENVIYNYITTNQTVSNTPKTYSPVNTSGSSTPPTCPNTGRPAVWHTYASGGGEWKCPGYDSPGTNNPGNGPVVQNPGTNNPGQTPPIIKNPGDPGTNDPGGRYGKKFTYQKVNNAPAAQYNVQPAKTYAPANNNVSYAPKAYSNNVQTQAVKPAYQYRGNTYQLRTK